MSIKFIEAFQYLYEAKVMNSTRNISAIKGCLLIEVIVKKHLKATLLQNQYVKLKQKLCRFVRIIKSYITDRYA